jgi:hypothetical protein
MFSRATRALTFDRKPFEQAFFDSDSAADAAILVSLVAAATYVGRVLQGPGSLSLPGLLQEVIGGVVSWLILGFATWFVATRLFKSGGRPQTMIALQGLAVLPLLLEMFGQIAGSIGLVWYLVVLAVGTREASDLSTRDASVSVLIGFAVAALFRAILGVPFAIFSGLF